MEKSILLYGDVQLYPSDLELLTTDSWLNDTLIEFYYEYLETTTNNSGVLFLRPCMVYLVQQTTVDDIPLLKECLPNFNGRNLIFMPINNNQGDKMGGTHWSLLVYDNNRFRHFDSCGRFNASVARELTNKLQSVLGAGQFINEDCAQQANGFDCGMYVLKFTKLILDQFNGIESNLLSVQPRDIQKLRIDFETLINTLIRNKNYQY